MSSAVHCPSHSPLLRRTAARTWGCAARRSSHYGVTSARSDRNPRLRTCYTAARTGICDLQATSSGSDEVGVFEQRATEV